jgi:hypothetical protein
MGKVMIVDPGILPLLRPFLTLGERMSLNKAKEMQRRKVKGSLNTSKEQSRRKRQAEQRNKKLERKLDRATILCSEIVQRLSVLYTRGETL